MTFGTNLILLISMFPVLPIMFFIMKYQTESEKFLYGIRIPKEHMQDEEIKRICKKYKRMLNWFAICLLPVPLLPLFISYFSIGYTIYMMWMLAVMIVLMFPYILGNKALKEYKEQHRWNLYKEEGEKPEEDESHWYYGMFYYNPEDKRTMVAKRVGIGTTTNMAKPIAKIGAVVLVLSLLIIPGSCIWLCMEEFTPIRVEISDTTVVANHIKTDYKVEIKDITDVELIDSLPSTYRKNGTGMDNLKKGTFRVEGYGTCELFLNPENKKFIVITYSDGILIVSDTTDKGTSELYAKIKEEISK